MEQTLERPRLFGALRKIVSDLHIQGVVDDLTFAAYKNNRLRRPDIKPEQWAKVFGEEQGRLLEERFLSWWRGQHPNESPKS